MIDSRTLTLIPLALQLELARRFEESRVDLAQLAATDVVLALLRVGTPQALGAAELIVGRPIQKCPSGMPPWPPKPASAPRGSAPRLSRKAPNPCRPTTDMFQRYRLLRVGMTVEQLLARGVTRRDLRHWSKHLEFTS